MRSLGYNISRLELNVDSIFTRWYLFESSLQSMLLQIHQSHKLKVSPEGDHKEDKCMLRCGSLVQFLQPQVYLNTFASFLTNLEVHVVLTVLF